MATGVHLSIPLCDGAVSHTVVKERHRRTEPLGHCAVRDPEWE
jgi:hypothetical protein